MSKSANRPSHLVYAVTKTGERNFWHAIGAAWVHGDGWGFNVKLDYLPLNGAEIVIRKPKVDEADATAGDRLTRRGPPSGGPFLKLHAKISGDDGRFSYSSRARQA